MSSISSKLLFVGLPSIAVTFIVAMGVLSYSWIPLLILASSISFMLFSIYSPLVGLLTWIMASPYLSPYIKISLPAGVPDLTLDRGAVACILMALMLHVVLKNRRLIPMGAIEKVMIFFLAVGFFSAIFQSIDKGSDFLIFFDENAIPFFIFVAAKNLFSSENETKKLNFVLMLLGLFIAFDGIYQYITNATPTLGYLVEKAQMKEMHIFERRAVGPFSLGQEYGGTLIFIIIWAIYQLLFYSQGFKKGLMCIGIGVMIVGVILSLTRAVWLGFFISLFILQIFNPTWRKFLAVSMAGMTVIFTLFWLILDEDLPFKQRITELEPIYQRIVNYKATGLMFLEKPIVGYGKSKEIFTNERRHHLSAVGSISAEYASGIGPSHNEFLTKSVQYGLLGFLPYLTIFFLIYKSGLTLMRFVSDKESPQYQFVVFFWSAQAGYLTQAMLVNISEFSFLSGLFFLYAGVLDGQRYRITQFK